jgi:ribosome biogenesis protein NSA1
MRIITGDECGLLKETIPELCRPKNQDKHSPSTQDGVHRVDPREYQSRSRSVVDVAFTSCAATSFAALRVNGSVELWQEKHTTKQSFGTYHCTGFSDNIFASNSKDDESDTQQTPTRTTRPIALDALLDKNRLCAADSLGRIAVLRADDSTSVEANYSPFAKQQASTISYTKGQYVNMNICSAMAVDSVGSRIAVAGRERETTLVDLETGNTVWKAKNLSPDPQTLLQHPMWSTALLFLDSASLGGSNHIMAAGTAYKQVRLYDVRTDSKTRRPISYTPEGLLSHRVTALCQIDSNHLVVGDSAGFLYSLDTRMLGGRKQRKGNNINLARFEGPVGSIRQAVKHDSLPIVATVGLDRMLRTYNVETRKQLDCVYLKQRLNCLLMFGDETWSDIGGVDLQDNDDIDVDDEVHDYVDSEDESASEDSTESTDDNVTSESDKDVSEDESDEDSDEEEEQELPPTALSKRRRQM